VIEALPTLNDAEQAQAVLAEKAVEIMARPSATIGGLSWLIEALADDKDDEITVDPSRR